jgi:hypothetical protein
MGCSLGTNSWREGLGQVIHISIVIKSWYRRSAVLFFFFTLSKIYFSPNLGFDHFGPHWIWLFIYIFI